MSRIDQRRRDAPQRGEGRQRILEAATDLFSARGFADVSMQQIADASGITKATMYHHFRNKEDLFVEVVRTITNTMFLAWIDIAKAGDPLHTTLKNIVNFIVEVSRNTNAWTIMSDIERHIDQETMKEIFTDHPEPHEALRDLFKRAVEAGEMRQIDPDLMAAVFSGMVFGLFHRGHEHVPPRAGDDDILLDILLHGIEPLPSPAQDS